MSLMTPEYMGQLTELTRQQWQEAAKKWEQRDQVVLLYAAQEMLCRARWGRKQSEEWIRIILNKIRTHELEIPENSATYVFAWFTVFCPT